MSRAFPDGPERGTPRRARRWVAPLLLGLACFLVFNANLRVVGAGDTLPARYLPLVVLKDHTVGLGANARLIAHGHPIEKPPVQTALPGSPEYTTYFPGDSYWMVQTAAGHVASLYPVVTPLLVTPLYVPAYLYLQDRGWNQPDLDQVAAVMEKLSASLLAALAAVLMFVLLRREGIAWALPLAVVFAFGTNTWAISSQALWQHGVGEVLITLGLLLVVQRGSPWRLAALGLVAVLIAANRPPDALIAAAFVGFAVWREPRDLKWLLAGAALPIAALLTYNYVVVGNPVGGYAGDSQAAKDFVRFDPLGPLGLLISPGRGLLIFTPFLIFVPLGLALRLKNPETKQLAIALAVAVVAQVLVYSQSDWRAGDAWGPRWLTDMLPVLIWMLAPAVSELRPAGRGVLVATMVAAVGIQIVGAFWYTGVSDERIMASGKSSMAAAWKPANLPYLVELQHGPAGPELLCNGRGYVDKVAGTVLTSGGATVPTVKAGEPIEGWAFLCDRTPSQLFVLIDGVVVGSTQSFTPRPDIDRAFGTTSPTGWRVIANTTGLTPGPHVMQLAGRIHPRSDVRMLSEITVNVPQPTAAPADGDLPALARRAADRITQHQRDGYWLTTFTGSQRYAAPTLELNTYTPALLVDLLKPVAAQTGVQPALTKARRFLGAQIEPNGLVRYHGLPNAPSIGTLGCVITPDVDDTALAWRIAGKGAADPRSRSMLRSIKQYRNDRGLYRTWLAPQDRYACINPGRDPNPADLVNQMHVYLMLRTLDPAAARKLCTAMQRVATDPAALSYYVQAPLVPYLRAAELSKRGCRLPLPKADLARPAAGQERWAELVGKLVEASSSRSTPAGRRSAQALLKRLGRDDFVALRQTPPLVYTNDPTASVDRFYWSEDVGYALWLRLYAASRGGAR